MTIRIQGIIGPKWRNAIERVRAVVMGVGDIPIWEMIAKQPDLPGDKSDWMVTFRVPSCPPIGGRFVLGVTLFTASDQPIAAIRSRQAFEVKDDPAGGILRVEYHVSSQSSISVPPITADSTTNGEHASAASKVGR